jgi:hypothetical protein
MRRTSRVVAIPKAHTLLLAILALHCSWTTDKKHGMLLNTVLAVTCDSYTSSKDCQGKVTDQGPCVWNSTANICEPDPSAKDQNPDMVAVTSVDDLTQVVSSDTTPSVNSTAKEITDGEFCSLPPDDSVNTGVACMGYFPIYFYNATTKACESYIYGGCGGTLNQFESQDACQKAADTFCNSAMAEPTVSPATISTPETGAQSSAANVPGLLLSGMLGTMLFLIKIV